MAPTAADGALDTLSKSAGPEAYDEALTMIEKLFTNIVDHPSESKFRRMNPLNAKLQSGIFRHAGAKKLFESAGFTRMDDGFLELSEGKKSDFIDARAAVARQLAQQRQLKAAAQTAAGAASIASAYQAAVNGGAKGAGLAELAALSADAGGMEVLQLLEKILNNIRRYPDTKKYSSVNLTKPAGKKVTRALPLLLMVGFKKVVKEGEEWVELPFADMDLIERLCGMIYWATKPQPTPELKPGSGQMSQALGAVLGAAIGDALGAPLAGKPEFSVTAKEIDKVLEMTGGGIWGMAPGQTSDSTELALCVADALLPAKCAADRFPLEDIAVRYGKWGQTRPFHTEQGNGLVFDGPLPVDAMMEEAKKKNAKGVGAGALVRCPIIAAFASNFPSENDAARVARMDTRLSHPSLAICEASAAYTVLARSLIKTSGDRTAALAQMRAWVEAEIVRIEGDVSKGAKGGSKSAAAPAQAKGSGKGYASKEEEFVPPGASLVAFKEMMSWIAEALDNKVLPFTEERLPSSARIAFTHAVRHVNLGSSFEVAMRSTLAGGGDCSANAAVVGGLIGAAVGVEGIPARWLRAVLLSENFQGQQRPQEFHPNRLPKLLEGFSTSAQ